LLRLVVPLPARRVDWELDVDLLLRGVGKALLILAVAWVARWALHRLSRRIIQHAQTGDPATAGARAQRAATLAQLLNHTGMVVITIVALLLALDIFINIGPLLAGAGVLGVAASLGGQAMMKDLFSGFVIVLEDQYAVGDRVRIDSVEGTVQLLTLRSTVVRSDDGALHFVANGSVAAVANLSRRNAGHVS
jgi:small conductance mechanosensitive channel